MTIFFGTNDASQRDTQTVPLERYGNNLETLIGMAQEKKIKVILIGPGLRDSRMREDADFGNNQRARAYGSKAAEVARKLGVPFIDMFSIMQEDGGFKEEDLVQGNHPLLTMHLDDGIHYSAHSRRLLYYSIKQVIRTQYPDLDSDRIPNHFPYYRDIDPNKIDEILA